MGSQVQIQVRLVNIILTNNTCNAATYLWLGFIWYFFWEFESKPTGKIYQVCCKLACTKRSRVRVDLACRWLPMRENCGDVTEKWRGPDSGHLAALRTKSPDLSLVFMNSLCWPSPASKLPADSDVWLFRLYIQSPTNFIKYGIN